jgi:hypothetical protein
MAKRIKRPSPAPTLPRVFEGRCTACSYEGAAYSLTCPECSRRTIKAVGGTA